MSTHTDRAGHRSSVDSLSLDVMTKLHDARRGNLTFAPEAGSQRLRDVINKGLTEEEILGGAREAFRGGWKKVKLYFMLGLPTETPEDRLAIADLANKIAVAYFQEVPKEKRNGRCDITVSTSFFVPKAFTPLQWARMYTPEEYLSFASTVYDGIQSVLNRRSIWYKYHEADGTVLGMTPGSRPGISPAGSRHVRTPEWICPFLRFASAPWTRFFPGTSSTSALRRISSCASGSGRRKAL